MNQKPEEIETKIFNDIIKKYGEKLLNKYKIPGTNIPVEDTCQFVYDKDTSLESNVRRYVSHIVDAQKKRRVSKKLWSSYNLYIVRAETRTDAKNANTLKNKKITKNKGGEIMQYCDNKIDVETLSASEKKNWCIIVIINFIRGLN